MSGAVLITGASTGIGEATTLRLDRDGFRVFAGVRKGEAGERLREPASERLHVIEPFDVTDADQVAAAAELVEKEIGGERLGGIVNNAGLGRGGPPHSGQ